MIKQFNLLLVDDEPRILKFLELRLKSSGYRVSSAGSGQEALDLIQTEEPDMVVLDILMPGMDGFETLSKLREFSSVPVIILSAREAGVDKVRGLELGADDYLSKPFNPDELVARVEAIRRRMSSDEDRKTVDFVTLGDLVVDFNKHVVISDGTEIQLTRIEWLLLSELVRSTGKLILYSDLLTRVWGPEYRDDVQILRTWISRLRQKIENKSGPPIIRTISKTGYMIEQPSD